MSGLEKGRGVPVEIVEQMLIPFFKNVLEHLKIWGDLESAERGSPKSGRWKSSESTDEPGSREWCGLGADWRPHG